MPLPKLNDMLPRFFDILADGKPHTHAEISEMLLEQFHVSESERAQKTRNGLSRFENLIAWCKAYGTMVQFTKPVGTDAIQLTSTGLNTVKSGTRHINVTYLNSLKK